MRTSMRSSVVTSRRWGHEDAGVLRHHLDHQGADSIQVRAVVDGQVEAGADLAGAGVVDDALLRGPASNASVGKAATGQSTNASNATDGPAVSATAANNSQQSALVAPSRPKAPAPADNGKAPPRKPLPPLPAASKHAGGTDVKGSL
jgi:hypothetical protein